MTEHSTLGGGITPPSSAPEPITFYKPAIDGLNKEQLGPYAFNVYKELTLDTKLNTVAGINCNVLYEPVPFFNKAPCELTIEGQNNTSIVLGRDRPSDMLSGYGGVGHTQAGAIDIVVGRMGPKPKMFDQNDNKWFTDPDFVKDSARIYISQKTDVDENFNLVTGKVGNAVVKSAIALKADGVRLIAREGIKLITSVDETNSQGGLNVAAVGIDLIAGNDESQRTLIEKIQDLVGIVDTFANATLTLVGATQNHIHSAGGTGPSTHAPFHPHVSSQLFKITTGLLPQLIVDLNTWKEHFVSAKTHGDSHISSQYNHVN